VANRTNAETEAAERFARDTGPHAHDEYLPYGHLGPCRLVTDRPHQMTVLHDDGLYRHLLFKSPDASWYWFELITWPGCLTFRGDVGDGFTFARLPDMFGFFRDSREGGINPVYWSEKLGGGRSSTMRYSEELFRRTVWQQVRDYGQDHRGRAKAVQEHFFGGWSDWDISREDEARAALDDFKYATNDRREQFQFVDTWEWSFKDFDWTFLWACNAIVWGIAQYDAAKATASSTADLIGASA
jgi:hypothetical protein